MHHRIPSFLMSLCLGLFAASGSSAEPKVLSGKVIRVTDGDTVVVLDGKEQYKVRLLGIDAPEKSQPYANKSKKALSERVLQKQVRVEWESHDKYKRVLGAIYVGEIWINKELVVEGWAWHYKKYSKDKDLAEAEKLARSKKRGVWQDANPVPPWEYRANPGRSAHRLNRPGSVTSEIQPPRDEKSSPMRYWLNTSSNIRHNQSCKWFEKTKHGRGCGSRDGKACGLCGG